MPVYLDVTALRIQQYLVRYPRLRSIVAASEMLANETRWPAIEQLVGASGVWNDAAGDSDGKVSLVLRQEEDAAEELARKVVDHLQERLPAARFEALWAEADSYPAALAAMTAQRALRAGIVTAPPTNSLPFQRLCDRCVVSPAARRIQGIENTEWSCKDCAARVPDVRDGGPPKAKPILDGYALPADFGELADLGTDRKRNHLATIYADGNSLGKFFKEAIKKCTPDQLNRLSAAVTEATHGALKAAAEATQPEGGEQKMASIAHVVGGDDVLVTVPASSGWPFAMTYLREFSDRVEQAVAKIAPDTGLIAPTASAGLVFSHKSFPFSSVFAIAADALERAKAGNPADASDTQEKRKPAAIAWIDITSDGMRVPSYRKPIPVDTLAADTDKISALAAVPASTRSNLETYLTGTDPFVAAARVRKLQRRLQLPGLAPYVDTLPALPVEEPSADDLRAARRSCDHLRNLLSLTDWWSHE